jgi:hypothetical protein
MKKRAHSSLGIELQIFGLTVCYLTTAPCLFHINKEKLQLFKLFHM